MKILVDECLPRALKHKFPDHECRTVREMGWSGQKNGALLALAESEFDVLITIDQSIEHQQQLARRHIALLILKALSNQIEDLEPILPDVQAALLQIRPGSVIRVGE